MSGTLNAKHVCAQCGREIEPADSSHYGEEYCDVNGEKIHFECMHDWAVEHRKECKNEYL